MAATTRTVSNADGSTTTICEDGGKEIWRSTFTQPTPAETNYVAIATWLDNLITQGENAVVNWSSLTAVQKDAAAKQTVQAVTRLARLARNNLSSSGA